jgi:hypothetical protein
MFDLEQSIAEWRQQMQAAGIRTPVPLEELEIHLREDVERQMRSGFSEQEAFSSAIKKIGQPRFCILFLLIQRFYFCHVFIYTLCVACCIWRAVWRVFSFFTVHSGRADLLV